MPSINRERRLYDLLLSLFNGDELLRFLRHHASEDLPDSSADLPPPTATTALIVDATIHQLARHGATAHFFTLLRGAFPRRQADIKAVEALWTLPEARSEPLAHQIWSPESVLELTDLFEAHFLYDREAANFCQVLDLQADAPPSPSNWQELLVFALQQGKLARMIRVAQSRSAAARSTLTVFEERIVRGSEQQAGAGAPKRTIVKPPSDGTIVATIPETLVPLWRNEAIADQLVFFPPAGGFAGNDLSVRTFQLPRGRYTVHLGRQSLRGDERNDYLIPHGTVPGLAASITGDGERVWLTRRPQCSNAIVVGAHLLQAGESIPLHHGQRIKIGRVQGIFVDGRFTRFEVGQQEIHPESGLLGRDGLTVECAHALQKDGSCILLLLRPRGAPERASELGAQLARELHARTRTVPVGCIDHTAIAVLPDSEASRSFLAEGFAGVSVGCFAGYCRVGSGPAEAKVRIDECLAAILKIAHLGTVHDAIDLAPWTLHPVVIPRFRDAAVDDLAAGGEAALFALAELDRLRELDERTLPVLEIELFQLLTAAFGCDAVYAQPATGVIGVSSRARLAAAAETVARTWRGLPPVGNGLVQVERDLVHTSLRPEDLPSIPRRALELTEGLVPQLEALPLPLALPVRGALASTSPLERMMALVTLTEAVSRFMAVCLAAMATRHAPGSDAQSDESVLPQDRRLERWWALSARSFRTISNPTGAVLALLTKWFDPSGRPAGWLRDILRLTVDIGAHMARSPGDIKYVNRQSPPVEHALKDITSALTEFSGWTLIAVERTDRVAQGSEIDAITYIDYTGSFERGTSRKISVQHSMAIGPFVYLMRFSEGLAVPLEPFLRRRCCPHCGAHELFWSDEPLQAPGIHSFHSVTLDHALEDVVTASQLPPGLRS